MSHPLERITRMLPAPEACTSLHVGAGDVFINAPGFEERTFAAAEILVAEPGARGLLLRYDYPPDPANRVPEMRTRLAARGVAMDGADEMTYSRFEPDQFPERLRARLREVRATGVVIDVSSMSRLAILLILDACQELNLDVRVFYAEAQSYAPEREEFERARSANELQRPTLSAHTGLFGCVRAAGLSSVAMQGQPTAAIAFMSFNETLTQALLNCVYPSRLFLINSRPPELSWREGATAWIHERLRRDWEEDNPVDESDEENPHPARVTSTLWYAETVDLLLRLYWELYVDHRVLLAPTGSKMQTVACAVARAMHPDVHIEYPTPTGFFDKLYSQGIGPRWLLPLGCYGDLIQALRDEEQLAFLEFSGTWSAGEALSSL